MKKIHEMIYNHSAESGEEESLLVLGTSLGSEFKEDAAFLQRVRRASGLFSTFEIENRDDAVVHRGDDFVFASGKKTAYSKEQACSWSNGLAESVSGFEADVIVVTRVLFFDTDRLQKTKEHVRLIDWKERTLAQCESFEAEHAVKKLSAKLVTCSECDSRIAKDRLPDGVNGCPVCGHDLRAPYIGEKAQWYRDKVDFEIQPRIDAEFEKLSKKAGCPVTLMAVFEQ